MAKGVDEVFITSQQTNNFWGLNGFRVPFAGSATLFIFYVRYEVHPNDINSVYWTWWIFKS
ncbi:hypothetical protein BCR42DRAFT_430054 [Absidia repens]|uniref:Uncharacterized protein n=1 Tax=Absidia repens TaxID=90262 RepID=A0A1X2HKD7_9FUNG|nr:hypothetical protein BCR42DRAFT_430054 [Absidia repens]